MLVMDRAIVSAPISSFYKFIFSSPSSPFLPPLDPVSPTLFLIYGSISVAPISARGLKVVPRNFRLLVCHCDVIRQSIMDFPIVNPPPPPRSLIFSSVLIILTTSSHEISFKQYDGISFRNRVHFLEFNAKRFEMKTN